jgi:hypothetical protein
MPRDDLDKPGQRIIGVRALPVRHGATNSVPEQEHPHVGAGPGQCLGKAESVPCLLGARAKIVADD